MSENPKPTKFAASKLFPEGQEEWSRCWWPWQLDFLIHVHGDIPPESWLKVFSQLCFWWGRNWAGHSAVTQTKNKIVDLNKVALTCDRSAKQISAWWLGTISVRQTMNTLQSLEALGLFTSKAQGFGLPTLRTMNRKLIEQFHSQWVSGDESVYHIKLDKNSWEAVVRKPGDSSWTPLVPDKRENVAVSSRVPESRTMGEEIGDNGDPESRTMGEEIGDNGDPESRTLLEMKGFDGGKELDRTNGNHNFMKGENEKTSELDFNLIHYLTDSLNDLISDDDFKYIKSSTVPERQTVIRIIQEISKQELLPCRLPTDASQAPSRPLLKTVARLLSILKDTWDLPVCQPIWRPGSESPIASFRTTILNAAKHYSQRMAIQAERPRNLHDWVYLEHRDPSSASSGLLYEISLMQKEQERLGSTTEKAKLLQRLTAAEIRLLDERLKPVPGGEKLPHPTAFWRRMLDWQEFMERHEKDLRFHAAIHAGWFRVQTRNCSCAMLLQLYDRFRYSQEKEPTAWVPLIDEDEWDAFAGWLRSQEGTELFVDLNFRSPLSVQEQEQALQAQEVERVTKTVKTNPHDEWDKEAVRERIRPEIPEISDALASYGDLLMRLHRSALVQRAVNRLHAAKTLLWWIQHPPKELWPDEEAPVALFAQGLLVQIRDEWYEHEAKLFGLATMIGLFHHLPTETQD